MEQWKDVVGYEGCYQVSSHGRIKSMQRKVACKNGSFREIPEKIVTPLFTKQGYLNIVASRKQKRETLVVHQLVAHYFIGDRPLGLVIDHIDGDKTNNKATNLRYVSCKQNSRKRKDVKLDENRVQQILSLVGKEPQQQIAKRFGISQSMVSKIKCKKLWSNE